MKNKLLFSVIIFCACFFAFLSLHAANAATYYVDSSRPDDSGNGLSQGAAWKTISKVNSSTFQPGDNILFKKGQSWHEQLTVSSSGTNGNPITFGSYGTGANPKIYRTDTYSSWWEHSLLLNGGMEYVFAGSPNDDFNDWSEFNWGDGTSIKGDTSVKNSGNTSAKLTSTGNGQAFSGTNYTSFTNYMTVSANADYYFKVSGRVGVSGDNALLLKIKDTGTNKYLDSSGNWQTNGTTIAMSWNGTTPNTWAQKAVSFKPGSTSLEFTFYNFQTGSAWIDDAYFMQGTGPSATKIWAGTINGNSNYGGAVLNGKRTLSYINFCADPLPGISPTYCADHGYDPTTHRIEPFTMASGYFNAPLNRDYFYYRNDSGSPPTMEVGARLNAILIKNKQYIVVDGIDADGPYSGVYPGESSCSGDNAGTCGPVLIHIGDHADNITIKNADISNGDGVGIWSGNTTTNIYYQNLNVHDNQSTGIYINARGGSVINSKVYENCLLVTDGGDCGGIGSYQGGNLTISNNELYHNGRENWRADSEIALVEGVDRFIVTKNYIHEASQGGIGIANGGDNSVIAYNIINGYGTGTWADYLGGFSGIILGGGAGPGARGVSVLNNVIAGGAKAEVNNTPPYSWPTEGCLHLEYDDSNLVVKNNIFFNNANRDIYVHGGASIAGAVFDNNIYYRTNYTDNWWIQGYPENSLSAWQSTYSQDAHSSTSNPLFTNASGNFSRASDFQLQSNSPAKDAGTDVGLTTDYAGTSVPQNSVPDIGAYEYAIIYSAADINQDQAVNITDFNILKTDFLKLAASLANPRSDINGDGQATIKDVGILMSGWR